MEKIKFNKKLTYLEKTLMITVLMFFLIFVGAVANTTVMNANGCKMPFKDYISYADDYDHFAYADPSEIQYPELSDKYPITFKERIYIFSIGDVFIYSGWLVMLLLVWRYGRIIHAYHQWRRKCLQ